jgi:surface antigen
LYADDISSPSLFSKSLGHTRAALRPNWWQNSRCNASTDSAKKDYCSKSNPFAHLNEPTRQSYGGQCTAHAWGRAYAELGVNLSTGGKNAGNWVDSPVINNTTGKTLTIGSTPKPNSIAVWKDGGAGHVAYVEDVKDGQVYFTESNWDPSNTLYGAGYQPDHGPKSISAFETRGSRGQYKIAGYIYLQDTPTLSRTNFDGAGSLISPQNDVYGGNKDLDIMQPHSNTGTLSTVVFQFKPDSSNCHHVDIYSSPVISAFIQSKFWSDSALSTAFYGTLPMSVAASSRGYTVVAVTSAAPLTSSVTVQAYCRPASSDNLNKAITFLPDDDSSKAVSLGNNYYWAGTGSVITSLGTGTGKEDDIVPTFDTKKSLVSFQWQPSPSCPKLKLYPTNTTSLTFKEDNEVSLKLWNEPDSSWRRQACGNLPGSLPCTIFAPVPKASSYYIVKVKIVAGGGAMRAKCVQ